MTQQFCVTREEHELITDIRDFRTLFHTILSRETSVRFVKTIDFVDVVRLVITCFAYVSRVRCDRGSQVVTVQ